MAIIQRAAGLAMGFLEVFLLKFYQWIVDTAPAGSWPVRLFTYLATGPFRRARPRTPPATAPRTLARMLLAAVILSTL